MITHVPYPNSLHVLLPTRVRTQSFSPSTKFDTSLHLTTDIPHNYPTRVVPESPALFVFNPKFKKKKKENRKLLHSVKRKFNSFLNFLFVSWEKEMAVGEEPILSRLDRLDNMVSLFSAYNENSKFKLRLKKMILFSFFFFFLSFCCEYVLVRTRWGKWWVLMFVSRENEKSWLVRDSWLSCMGCLIFLF